MTPEVLAAELRARPGDRVVAGIAGPPGVGKSTLAGAVVAELGVEAALLPLDGFHLSFAVAAEQGLADRRGAPETFDVEGYLALLRRVRTPGSATVYAPEYRREIAEPVAGALAIPAAARIVVTEGNYLLLDAPGWREIRPLLDLCWYLDDERDARIERLVARHVAHGKTQRQARDWVERSDERNAELIGRTRARATAVVRWQTRA